MDRRRNRGAFFESADFTVESLERGLGRRTRTRSRTSERPHVRGEAAATVSLLLVEITVSLHQTEVMRTTLTLDQDVYEAAVRLARSSGERLGKIVSELARRGLATPPRRAAKSKRRFPTFDVPPGAPVIPASRVQKVIDEVGLFS